MRCKGVSPFESAKYDGVPASKSIMAVLAKLRLTAPEIEKEKCCYFFVVVRLKFQNRNVVIFFHCLDQPGRKSFKVFHF